MSALFNENSFNKISIPHGSQASNDWFRVHAWLFNNIAREDWYWTARDGDISVFIRDPKMTSWFALTVL